MIDVSRYSVRSDVVETPSLGEGVTACTSTLVTLAAGAEPNELLPVLVVAVRGSSSNMDHVINAAEPPRDTRNFIVSCFLCL